jgi:hypothetical protein
MPKRPIKQTQKIIDEIVERLGSGQTLTAICAAPNMPTVRSLLKWCAQDREVDRQVFDARIRGMPMQRDEAVDIWRKIMGGEVADPKLAYAMNQAARDMAHNSVLMLSRLDRRFREKTEIAHTGPVVIGWNE